MWSFQARCGIQKNTLKEPTDFLELVDYCITNGPYHELLLIGLAPLKLKI